MWKSFCTYLCVKWIDVFQTNTKIIFGPFYTSSDIFHQRKCYASTGLCESNVSIRLSVTRRYCVRTKKASIMISSLSGSPTILVFVSDAKFHPGILRGSPERGPQTRVG